METVQLELNASEHGWNCNGCGLFFNCIGLPIFGNEKLIIKAISNWWIENKPEYHYCPGCGKPFGGDKNG